MKYRQIRSFFPFSLFLLFPPLPFCFLLFARFPFFSFFLFFSFLLFPSFFFWDLLSDAINCPTPGGSVWPPWSPFPYAPGWVVVVVSLGPWIYTRAIAHQYLRMQMFSTHHFAVKLNDWLCSNLFLEKYFDVYIIEDICLSPFTAVESWPLSQRDYDQYWVPRGLPWSFPPNM